MSESSSNYRRFTPRRTGDASPLGELESSVMQVVWAESRAISVNEVHSALSSERDAAYTTIKTTMERLAEKGILRRARDGKAYLYESAISQEELERRIVSQTIDRLVEQFPDAVASFFLRPDPNVPADRLTMLKEAIDRKRTSNDG